MAANGSRMSRVFRGLCIGSPTPPVVCSLVQSYAPDKAVVTQDGRFEH